MNIGENLQLFQKKIEENNCKLIAVSKTKPNQAILEAYTTGFRDFGENKIQELVRKSEALPKDIRWHMIGHLQRNKVKYIAPFVHLIHAVDSLKLLKEINKQAKKSDRTISCLLQIHIAQESTKFGMNEEELFELLQSDELKDLKNIKIKGLMGMATFTGDKTQVRNEFRSLKVIFEKVKKEINLPHLDLQELSMGMSADYEIAIEEGSTMIRVGSAIFGQRE